MSGTSALFPCYCDDRVARSRFAWSATRGCGSCADLSIRCSYLILTSFPLNALALCFLQEQRVILSPESTVVQVITPAAEAKSPLKDADPLNNNNTTAATQEVKQDAVDSKPLPLKVNGVNGHPAAESPPAIPASPTSFKSSSSGSTSGLALSSLGSGGEGNLELSLNMSVSQMRQMLAQKKKVDPKKMAMDLKQKYEIISSM